MMQLHKLVLNTQVLGHPMHFCNIYFVTLPIEYITSYLELVLKQIKLSKYCTLASAEMVFTA